MENFDYSNSFWWISVIQKSFQNKFNKFFLCTRAFVSFSLILGSWELGFWNEPIGLIWVQVYGLYSWLLNSVWPNHFWPNASLELGSSWIRPNVNLTSSRCVWDKACSAWLDSFGIGPNLMTTFFLFPFFFFFLFSSNSFFI